MTIWHGPKPACDFCKLEGKEDCIGTIFYDAATVHGPWACMCRTHYHTYGLPMGQEYFLLANEWHKIRDLGGNKS